jgi:hypothetical protein
VLLPDGNLLVTGNGALRMIEKGQPGPSPFEG